VRLTPPGQDQRPPETGDAGGASRSRSASILVGILLVIATMIVLRIIQAVLPSTAGLIGPSFPFLSGVLASLVASLVISAAKSRGWMARVPLRAINARFVRRTAFVAFVVGVGLATTLILRASSRVPTIGVEAAQPSLPAAGAVTYVAANTVDGDPFRPWCSPLVGSGAQTLTFHFKEPINIDRIEVRNGYVKKMRYWRWNGRVESVELSSNSGARSLTLADTWLPQTLTESLPQVSTLQMRITAVYPGDRWQTVCLSEIAFRAR
jgi:hypothetical protein